MKTITMILKPITIKQTQNIHWCLGEYADSKDADVITAIDLYGENSIAEKI